MYIIELNIHAGLSLGAHVVGYAGRHLTLFTGHLVHRITGLDPAKPCFVNNIHLIGLRPGDAKFVDVIHTDPGILGTNHRIGDADFFLNG